VVNRPKAIGTAGETAVVRYLQANGFPNAERRALAGAYDLGDITGTPDVAWEVKAGHAAWEASDKLIDSWLVETEVERVNAHASLGFLVVARRGKPPAQWWAVCTFTSLQRVMGYELTHDSLRKFPCRLTLVRAVDLLRIGGWGDPLPLEEGSPA